MKLSFDQYEVYAKGKSHRIVVFPKIANIWFYDAHPAENTYDVQGDTTAIRELAKAFALLIRNPDIIVYLPIKRDDKLSGTTFNMVITRSYLEVFKPSVWYKLKPNISRRHKVSNYKMDYCPEKINDILDAHIDEWNLPENWQRDDKQFLQKELGDTVFCAYSLHDLYRFHSSLTCAADYMENHQDRVQSGWGLGWCLSDWIVEEMLEDERKELEKYDNW